MKRVVLITGSEQRHSFFRKYIGSLNSVVVVNTFCESTQGNINNIIESSQKNELRLKHLALRNVCEDDFFKLFNICVKDKSNPIFIKKGEINNEIYVNEILRLNPDLIISYGCSIIKSELLKVYKDRFINIHLGLSPYYRGAGTNYWPMVNKELQCVGVTFMFIDKGIDTGKIIHQYRGIIYENDTVHTIGNRIIRDMSIICGNILENFDDLIEVAELSCNKEKQKLYKKKDFTEVSLEILFNNFSDGIVEYYLANKDLHISNFPIIENIKCLNNMPHHL